MKIDNQKKHSYILDTFLRLLPDFLLDFGGAAVSDPPPFGVAAVSDRPPSENRFNFCMNTNVMS